MKLKTAILLFSTGILLGVALSPFTSDKPGDVLNAPLPNSYAMTPDEQIIVPIPEITKDLTLENYLVFFEQQQTMLNPTDVSAIDQSPLQKNTEPESESKPETLSITPISTQSGSVTIAFFGDSMIDTMGTDCPYFASQIKQYYPNLNFQLLNYGIGAQQIKTGLERINSTYTYKDRNYLPITQNNPQIIILDSFAYNPYDNVDQDLNTYKQQMSQLISQLQTANTQVVFLATIAPLKVNFGQGPGGVNWPADLAYTHATKIQTYMEAAISVADAHNLPIIDLYHQTLQANGEGIAKFVSSHDGIHPSELGHQYIASQISEFIAKNKML